MRFICRSIRPFPAQKKRRTSISKFSPDFFDLIIVDECHRGSAAEDSAWREILDYFSSATQIGLTATPKETEYVSNIDYFGPPVYTYSLKQGIEDGFLAPYKVVRIDIDKDLTGWRPEPGQRDKYGKLIEDRTYNQRDYDRELVLEKRTELVAQKITQFLRETDPYAKTIVFCENIDHAERMCRALINANADLYSANNKYIIRITGDSSEGKAELDNFIMPESRYPVIVTTSKLMSTGIDAQTCKLIVIDQRIESMSLFKQIIGRGTRTREEFNKYFFTIMDFKKATELFADPEFDGDPVQIYEPGSDGSPVPPDTDEGTADGEGGTDDAGEVLIGKQGQSGKRNKYYVNNVEVFVVAERVQYRNKEGKLITESLKDYTRKAINQEFASLDDFINRWSATDQKEAILVELAQHGILFDALEDEIGKEYDPFDLICHIAFDHPPLTRRERAEQVRKRNYFARYSDNARAVLSALLDKYADEGIENIESLNVLRVQPFNQFGTATEILTEIFGGKDRYLEALRELERELYKVA
jgi:Type I site-specific restriction-modification system, R (restriction) subunit and related helicases